MKHMTVRIPKELYTKLCQRAKRVRRPVSDVVRQALVHFLGMEGEDYHDWILTLRNIFGLKVSTINYIISKARNPLIFFAMIADFCPYAEVLTLNDARYWAITLTYQTEILYIAVPRQMEYIEAIKAMTKQLYEQMIGEL